MSDSEVTFDITKSEDGKEITLIITSTEAMSNADYILYIESLLTDLIRAEKQLESAGQLH